MFRRESAFSELLVSTHFREKCKNINTRNHGKKEVESRKENDQNIPVCCLTVTIVPMMTMSTNMKDLFNWSHPSSIVISCKNIMSDIRIRIIISLKVETLHKF